MLASLIMIVSMKVEDIFEYAKTIEDKWLVQLFFIPVFCFDSITKIRID